MSKECDHDEVFMNWSTYNFNASSLTANSPLWVLGHHGDNICLDRTGQSEVCFHFNGSSQKNKRHLLNFSAGPPWMLLYCSNFYLLLFCVKTDHILFSFVYIFWSHFIGFSLVISRNCMELNENMFMHC